MTDQQPRATRDGITWDTTTTPSAATAPQPAMPPEPPTRVPAAGPAEPGRPKKKRRRWGWISLGAVLALLLAWSIYDRFTAPDEGPTSTTTQTGQGSVAAEKVALTYFGGLLTNQPDVACPLSANEASCRRVAAVSKPFPTTAAPHVVQVARVTRGTHEQAATAVVVEFTIKGQSNPIRRVGFVRDTDGKIVDGPVLGSSDQGKSLQQLFQEAGQ